MAVHTETESPGEPTILQHIPKPVNLHFGWTVYWQSPAHSDTTICIPETAKL